MANDLDRNADTPDRIRKNWQRIILGGITNTLSLSTAGGLQVSSGSLEIKLASTPGLSLSSSGITIDLDNTNPCLALGATGIGVTVNSGGSLTKTSTGVAISSANFTDITTTVNGTTWTINAGVVTLAKMANLATQTIIGRATAGTGVPEALTIDGGLSTTGTQLMTKLRSVFTDFADAGSVGTGETDLYSHTLAAGLLATNGDSLCLDYGTTLVNSASTKQIKLYFGGTAYFDTGALTISATSSASFYVRIIRVSSSIVRWTVVYNTVGASAITAVTTGEITGLTLANTQVIKITGTAAGGAAANNDIVAKNSTIRFEGA